VNLEEEDYFVELTSDKLPFSSIHHSLRNSFVLEINKDRSESEMEEPIFLNPENKKKNVISRKTNIRFKGTDMDISVSSVKTGDYGTWMRDSYRDIGTEQQEKRMLESIGKDQSGVKLKKLKFDENLYNTNDTVSYAYDYTASNGLTRLSNLLLFRIPYNEKQDPVDFLSDNTRKYPVDFWQYLAYDIAKEVITVEIPEGKKLLELPKDQKFSCAMADYSLTFRVSGKILTITRMVNIKTELMPVSDLAKTRAFFEEVVKADDTQLAFQ
jgi:hypothetical protein